MDEQPRKEDQVQREEIYRAQPLPDTPPQVERDPLLETPAMQNLHDELVAAANRRIEDQKASSSDHEASGISKLFQRIRTIIRGH